MYQKLIFELSKEGRRGHVLPKIDVPQKSKEQWIPKEFIRTRDADLPQVPENEVVRHYVDLSVLNHHVDKAFYPLGSCTMKYNPKINEQVAADPAFLNLHPRQPESSAQGALQLMYELGEALKAITGFSGITLQPAAGAHGELTGLLLIRKYHDVHHHKKTTILVPDSAHGTNPASAHIAGFQTKSIKSNPEGTVDMDDLKAHLNEDVAGMMLTNPNTLGIFENQIEEIRKLMDSVDALLYMDGANLNALFGLVRPGDMGFDVMHINLHKSFSTPHGGGGPGSGPVAVNDKLKDFLPVPVVDKTDARYYLSYNYPDSIGRVQAFYSNFGILVRAYAYIRMVGREGFRRVAEQAIINANYIKTRLKDHYDLGYTAPSMHEFVLSAEKQKKRGARALDIAKRLLDFGIHPPTIYFPLIVKEALMIEPTESESKEMLDAFCEAMLRIDEEIGKDLEMLHSAPHSTPVGRLDEAAAARNLDINYYKPN